MGEALVWLLLVGWLVCNQHGKVLGSGISRPKCGRKKRGLSLSQKLARPRPVGCKWKPWELSGHHRHLYADDNVRFNNLNLIVNLSLLSIHGWYDSMVRYL